MNGLRTRTRSDRIPTITSATASNAQNQLPREFAFDWLYPNTVWKKTGKKPTAR